ncbi:MAG: phosphotransferase [Lachnospiraceae bacterium]|nr:phosphotransferase [Lachnospiraceae bacterium]
MKDNNEILGVKTQRVEEVKSREQILEEINKVAVLEKYDEDREYERQLTESKRTFGDSSLMKNVKKDLAEIEKLLETDLDTEYTDRYVTEIEQKYFKAIESCDKYCQNRDSKKESGIERKKLVEINRSRLIRELELLETSKELVASGKVGVTKGARLRDVFLQVRLYNFAKAPLQKEAPEKEKTSETNDKALTEVLKTFKVSGAKFKDKEKEKAYAAEIGNLRRELKAFPQGKAYSTYINIQGNHVLIRQDENDTVTISTGEASVCMRESIQELLSLLDYKMIEEQDRMLSSDLMEMIGDQSVEIKVTKVVTPTFFGNFERNIVSKDVGDIQKATTRLSRYLELKTKRPATFFSTLNTHALRMMAYGIAAGKDVTPILEELDKHEKSSQKTKSNIYTRENFEIVQQSRIRSAEMAQKVKYEKKENVDLKGWEQDEFEVKNLLADLVFSKDAYEADDSLTEPGERIRRMLVSNMDALASVLADNYREDQTAPSLIERVMNKLPISSGDEEEDKASFQAEMKNAFAGINAQIDKKVEENFPMICMLKGINTMGMSQEDIKKTKQALKRDKEFIKSAIGMALNQPDDEMRAKFLDIDLKIEQMVEDSSKEMQKNIGKCVDSLFKSGVKVEWTADLQNPNEKGISATERKKRIKDEAEALTQTIKDAIQGDAGQGKFIKTVFKNYFEGSETIDKRSMFASAIRSSTPMKKFDRKPPAEGASPEEIKAYKEAKEEFLSDEMGKYLGGVLKGAGPLFQKLLQGLPTEGMPESMRESIGDVKSKLLPIPEDVVKAQLLGMVDRSKGKITEIRVEKSLGAASVGETFKCKVFGPEFPAEGTDVVVKLLKPDVRNRMMREKKIMLRCAEMTDDTGGMKATYLGQLSRIEEELDLTIEARNIKMGEIYDKSTKEDKSFDGVRSEKFIGNVEATTNSMLLEMAPGTTVDRYMEEINQKIKDYKAQVEKKEDESEETYLLRVNKLRLEISEEIARMSKRQKYMATLGKKWVTEGIFGAGYYHGDLHAGNIMINDDGVTIIDFGNATVLDEKQQINVTKMVGAAAVGDPDEFMAGLYNLLKPEFQTVFKEKKTALSNELKKCFCLGNRNAAGQRIAVALLKAQELGIEVPSSIFNFSQCQLRLQNAIDGMAGQIDELVETLALFDKSSILENSISTDLTNLMLFDMKQSMRGNQETAKESLKRYYSENLCPMHMFLDTEDLDMYDKNIMDGSFMKERVDPVRDLNVDEAFKNLFTRVEARLKDLKANKDVDVNAFIMKEVKGILDKSFTHFMFTGDVQNAIKEHFLYYQEELKKGDDADPAILKEQGGEGDTLPGWLVSVKSYVKGKTDLVTNMIKAADAYTEIKDKKDVKDEDKEAAMTAFKEAYKPYKLNLNVCGSDDSSAGQRVQFAMTYFEMDYLDEQTRDAVLRMMEDDEETGAQLFFAYNEFLEARKSLIDVPVKAIMDTVKDRKEQRKLKDRTRGIGRIEMLMKKEKFAQLMITMTSRKINGLFDNISFAYLNEADTFVDVMGEAINENLSKSFDRMGFFKSVSYKKKLDEEEASEKIMEEQIKKEIEEEERKKKERVNN